MGTLKEFLDKAQEFAQEETNGGYSQSQRAKRFKVEVRVLEKLKKAFPDEAPHLETGSYYGIGYFSRYSDFTILYKGIKLIGIGTHAPGIGTSAYRAEYDFVCPRSMVDKTLSLDDAIAQITGWQKKQKIEQLLLKVNEKRSEIEALEKEIEALKAGA